MTNKKIYGFALIEILVWIFIFSLWLVSMYALISSVLRVNEYNKNFIIATNLAREQIELFRNIRDSNYQKIQKYNQINPPNTNYSNVFLTWSYYKIENNYSQTATFPISVQDISWFVEWKDKIGLGLMDNYKLCLDNESRYTYDCGTIWNTNTFFYKYLKIDEVKDINWIIENALKLKSKIIWYKKWYHEFELNTIITDWKRL